MLSKVALEAGGRFFLASCVCPATILEMARQGMPFWSHPWCVLPMQKRVVIRFPSMLFLCFLRPSTVYSDISVTALSKIKINS